MQKSNSQKSEFKIFFNRFNGNTHWCYYIVHLSTNFNSRSSYILDNGIPLSAILFVLFIYLEKD